MNGYVEKFLSKVKREAPSEISIALNQEEFLFESIGLSSLPINILRYKCVSKLNKGLILEINHVYNQNTTFNRLEVHSPGKSSQITCFNFGTTNLMHGQEIVEISQIVNFSGQGEADLNKSKKEKACQVFEREGLLLCSDTRAPRWHLGTYNNKNAEWLYEQNTTGFLRNYLKVALVMGFLRENRDIQLNLDNNKEKIKSPDEYLKKVESLSRYPEFNKERVIHPNLFNKYRELCDEIGLSGEEYVLQYEMKRLVAEGRADLATEVKHISLENCAAGYDILSYSADGHYRYIECKATKGLSKGFEISANEWKKAIHYREQYYIYRVTEALISPSLSIINDPYKLFLEKSLLLTPTAYKVDIK